MKLYSRKLIFTIAVVGYILFSLTPVNALKSKKFDSQETKSALVSEATRHKNKVKEVPAAAPAASTTPAANAAPAIKAPLDTLSKEAYRELNQTYVQTDVNQFTQNTRKWDYKLLDKQLEDIYQDMNLKDKAQNGESDRKSFLRLFIQQFETCDKNADNILDSTEFATCMTSDPYLSLIQVPSANYAAINAYTDPKNFSTVLFQLLDAYNNGFLNFHDYLQLRLYAFSWKKCSVNGPFLEEVNFECAIEIASGFKTLSRNAARRLFQLGLDLSNSQSIRNLDFISYVVVASSARLYGKLNGKEDSDLSRSEFNLALDGNTLPMRYNQDIVNSFFQLVSDHDKPNQGVDLTSFVLYDFSLRLFDVKNVTKKYNLNFTEFNTTLGHFLFPNKTNQELNRIPQNILTANSYSMYTYLNITNFNTEGDHLIKSFLEASVEEHVAPDTKAATPANNVSTPLVYNQTATAQWIFQALDSDGDGFINFYEYGTFFQVSYIFVQLDKFNKGRIVAGDLNEALTHYSGYPSVSYTLRERAKRFSLFPTDLYVDVFNTLLVLRIDDIVAAQIRRLDKTTVTEPELKHMLGRVNLKFVPEGVLNTCLRGTDGSNIPLYDWECSFVQGISKTLQFYQSSFDYQLVKNENLTLTNTVFQNPTV